MEGDLFKCNWNVFVGLPKILVIYLINHTSTFYIIPFRFVTVYLIRQVESIFQIKSGDIFCNYSQSSSSLISYFLPPNNKNKFT